MPITYKTLRSFILFVLVAFLMAPTQECIYFKRDGYCAKGQYCTFLHVVANNTKKLAFQNKGRPASPKRPTVDDTGKKPYKTTTMITSVSKGQNPADQLWNHFDNIANDLDDNYCGFASQQNTIRPMRYSTVARLSIRDESESNVFLHSNTNNAISDGTKRTICPFYLLGSCRFGSFCRNSHERSSNSCTGIPEGNSHAELQYTDGLKMSSTVEAEQSYECGICMENPTVSKSKSFGILSNCDCVFCLDCIRNWRKDGLAVAKKTEQVR